VRNRPYNRPHHAYFPQLPLPADAPLIDAEKLFKQPGPALSALAPPKTARKNRSSRANARPKPRPASREVISSRRPDAIIHNCFRFEELREGSSAPTPPKNSYPPTGRGLATTLWTLSAS
jgi:hypothetical protein